MSITVRIGESVIWYQACPMVVITESGKRKVLTTMGTPSRLARKSSGSVDGRPRGSRTQPGGSGCPSAMASPILPIATTLIATSSR